MKDTEALEKWLASTQHVRETSGRLRRQWRQLLNEQGVGGTTKRSTTTPTTTPTRTQQRLRARTSAATIMPKYATSAIVLPDTVTAGPTPFTSERHAPSERSKVLLSSFSGSAVIAAVGNVLSAASVDKKSLQVGRATRQDLCRRDSRTSNYGGVVCGARTKDGVEGGLSFRTAEVVENPAQFDLYESATTTNYQQVQHTGAVAKTRRSSSATRVS